ncbi:MAG: putative manganese-dependent inorganic diphosphatase, partial [Akkermansiaceae bacterium]
MKKSSDNMPLYVIGHKNPDTDSICAAIAYADLLQQKGRDHAQAARCGKVPSRTEWVLEQAGMEKPVLLDDVYASAEMICRKEVVSCLVGDTFLTAYRKMLASGVRSIPVVDNAGCLCGMLKYLDLLQLLMPSDTAAESVRRLVASTANIAALLEAETSGAPLEDEETQMVLLVGASSVETVNKRLSHAQDSGDIGSYAVICGDRPIIQQTAIDHGVKTLIVTGGFSVSSEMAKAAEAKGVLIMECAQDTATTAKLVRCARQVNHAMETDFLQVMADDNLKDLRKRLAHQKQHLFPVVDPGSHRLLGVFSKSDLIDPQRIQLVLVDHNEYSQAIDGVSEAEILEVIDHHRLAGDVVSREAIRYLNEPVGSTSTLVAREYRYAGLAPNKGIAMCLLAGMVSDTLNLTSPTTTDLDREILTWLCGLASVDAAEFTHAFFASGSLLAHNSAEEAIRADRKVFEENGARVSISHIEECGMDLFEARHEELTAALHGLLDVKGYDLALLIVTDVTRHH